MPISQDYITGLSKQVFIVEYLLNGLFPCQSDIVRSIRAKKREWKFNDKFEYRMLLAHTNTGGSLNSQVFKNNVSLIKPGELTYGTYRATYGTVSDGFDVDMTMNLETADKKAAFEQDFAVRMHSLRMNVAALFKNFAIHGQFGVVHQLRKAYINDPTPGAETYGGGVSPQYKDNQVHQITGVYLCPNTEFTPDNAGFAPTVGPYTGMTNTRVPFRISVPINVFNSNFKTGKYLIKTSREAYTTGTLHGPWGRAYVGEMYLVLENQPGFLTLLSVGTVATPWLNGEFLEVVGNRETVSNDTVFETSWQPNAITVADGPYAGNYAKFNLIDTTAEYSSENNAIVGAMEGIADLLPFYTDPEAVEAGDEARLGIDRPFRDQVSRTMFSTEQAGGFVMQYKDEHIIDAIMRGAFLTKSTVPYADIGVWMNPVTRIEMGYEEGDKVRVLRDNFVEGPIVYQRGIKTTSYQIGNQVVNEVMEDMNMPTDVIIIGPKNDLSYNCWDNAQFELDKYIQDTWGKSKPPAIQDIKIPNDLVAKLDLSQRITYGSPTLSDGVQSTYTYGNNIRHPRNRMPIAMHEMGALFTEYPYSYTVIKLREPIFSITTV
jgi:hypothetical protein